METNGERKMIGSKRGFLMAEALVGLGLVVMVIGTSVAALTSSQQYAELSRSRLLAINAARSVLEATKDTPLSQIPNLVISGFVPAGLSNGRDRKSVV